MKNKRWRKWIYSFFGCSLFAVGLFGTINYLVDPLQFYRRGSDPMFSTNQRYQNPGLVKNYEYDTLVLGTSMSANFRKSYIDNKLGSNSLRTSFDGGSMYVQFLTQSLAVSCNKNLKKIIWLVDIFSLTHELGVTDEDFPLFMYTGDKVQLLLKYLLSTSVLYESMSKLTGLYRKLQLDTLNNWNNLYRFSIRDTLTSYQKHEFVFRPTSDTEKNINTSINEYLLSNKNVDVDYIIVFPPYSFIFYYEGGYKPNYAIIDFWHKTKRDFFRATKVSKNMVIYDFQDAYEIIYDLNNYRDASHYSQAINDWMIDRISEKDERFFVKDEETYEKRLKNFIRAIDMTSDFGTLVTRDNLDEHLEFLRKNILENLSQDVN